MDVLCLGRMSMESDESDLVNAFTPGLYAAMNCNLALVSVGRGEFVYNNEAGGHRGESPSAGSMTPYHNGWTVARKDIPAGGEFFLFYGSHWFKSRTEQFGLIPLKEDYDKAERLLKDLRKMEDHLDLQTEAREDLYSILANFSWESRVTNAFPREYAHMNVEQSMQALHQPNATLSLDELRTTGRCVDNIRHGESTLEGAGRGAFATRSLSEGTIVTGSPLMHVPDFTLAEMYDSYFDNDLGALVADRDEFTGYQLCLNYCMSHRNMSFLLCPYGSGVGYMNHDREHANVKMQWALHGQVAHNETWLLKTPEKMQNAWTGHLGVDYIATRDIEKGEELFMDYGKEWEEAWQKHVEEWEPTEEDENYMSAADWNLEKEEKEGLLTQKEQEWYRYPQNLLIRCHPFLYSEDSQGV